jgi:hypothetical protein
VIVPSEAVAMSIGRPHTGTWSLAGTSIINFTSTAHFNHFAFAFDPTAQLSNYRFISFFMLASLFSRLEKGEK